MTTSSNRAVESQPLGLSGFSWADLHEPAGLERLHEAFLETLRRADPELGARFDAYRGDLRPREGERPQDAELMIAVAEYVSAFLGKLFGIDDGRELLRKEVELDQPILRMKNEFMVKRVFKRGAPDRPAEADYPALDARARLVLDRCFPGVTSALDAERALARAIVELLDLQKLYERRPAPTFDELPQPAKDRCASLRATLAEDPVTQGLPDDELERDGQLVRNLLQLFDHWSFARALHPEGKRQIAGFISYRLPKKWDHQALVEVKRPLPQLPEAIEGPDHHLRRRDGFKLTDDRGRNRDVLSEVNYCILCHERSKDSCAKGLHEKPKEGDSEPLPFKKNPLGTSLHGCPLEEHISEMHLLKGRGDSIAALAMATIRNPMLPGTGHRICNDCMKSCIYQTQDPVNTPQIETTVLTDVLQLPYGFEVWSLLSRWNPLHVERPFPLPFNGRKILVVGLGPAGYTLAHHLLNEGFGVVAVDGLKIEPLPEKWLREPVRDWKAICAELDERILSGFGGVSEYGITVRWDKNFLTTLYLNLARRETLSIFGGVRFGGTLTLDDAWRLGFDHVAIAAGAGRPTIIPLKNNLLRGIRKASDFLMALQLSGAFKRDSMASLQVRLPAIVIGGGLTAIDTATELAAYYPVQVEKTLARWETLVREQGVSAEKIFSAEELPVLEEFLAHGREVRAERARAKAAGELPDFVPLLRKWGGVSLVYRKALQDSPAYRLNHEEVQKSLEEGITYVECMDPQEAIPDASGAVQAIRFERQRFVDGRWSGSGELVELPARTICVAAGTAPNVTYEKEFSGSFRLDGRGQFFQSHTAVRADDGTIRLTPAVVRTDLSGDAGFFTSYLSPDKTRCVSFYGDNHPQYAGSVVKAMASAKDGYAQVTSLYEAERAKLDPNDQAARDAGWQAFQAKLDDALRARVVEVRRLTSTIVDVIVRAPFAAQHFQPGQFYRLQNYESSAPVVDGTRLVTEGMALTGAWVDKDKGLLSLIVLEMGGSSRLCSALRPGEEVVCMGPTGTPTEIPRGEKVLLAGGGLGNAVLFSIAKALRENDNRVIYFAGYRNPEDVFKREELERGTEQVIWATDKDPAITPGRPQDRSFVGNIVQAMVAYAKGELGDPVVPLDEIDRIIAIGSDRMMAAVRDARRAALAPYLKESHEAIGSINSPMQCMMKEICAQCLQRQIGPDGKEKLVFTCMNQDQKLDEVDFAFLNARLRTNAVQEKIANLWLDRCLARTRN